MGWQQAGSVDGLIATTAGIAVFGFVTLWSFGLKPIRELGVASALGVVWLLVLAVFFLPALHVLGGGRLVSPAKKGEACFAPTGGLFDEALERLASSCQRVAAWLSQGQKPWGIVVFVCSLFTVVAVLFAQGQIVSRTRALEFIRGTLVEKEARLSIPLLILPRSIPTIVTC